MPPKNPTPEKPAWPKLVLRRADQGAAAAVLTLALLLLAGHWQWQTWRRGRLVEVERAAPLTVQFQLNVNSANWPEFCLLPGVGETLAKRIVEHREEHGPFRDLNGLRQVRGIGPKTFEGLRPYLMPLADIEATAGEMTVDEARRTN